MSRTLSPETASRIDGLRAVHKANAVILITFVFFHVANHLSGLFGIDAYNSVQALFRTVYRHPMVEPVLLTVVSVQLIAGAALLVRALRRGRPQGYWQWVQILSGGFFFVFMVQHLYSLGMVRLYFDLETDFYWPASVMSGPPFLYYFAPYYFLGVVAIMTHIGVGLRYLVLEQGAPEAADMVGHAFMGLGVLIGAFIVLMLAGAFFPITIPQDMIDYLRWYDPSFAPR